MKTPCIVANGLACLDVMNADINEPPKLSTGGCPNALILLKERGWRSIPIVDLGGDRAGDYVFQEFNDWGLDVRFVQRNPDIHTPIYVLRHRDGGHFYGKECPYCSQRFPLYEPISTDRAAEIRPLLPEAAFVYYFDKVSQAALDLAAFYKERSALLMFEPNRIDDEDLFRRSVEISDIVKYSSERRAGVRAFTDGASVPLELETAGAEGLNYRIVSNQGRSEWRRIPPASVERFVDAAGAGDWLTAGLLHSIQTRDAFESVLLDEERLCGILMEGQKSSAYNCQFAGARGALYAGRAMLQGYDFCPYCRGESRERN